MKKFTPVLAVLLCGSLVQARQEKLACGTHAEKSAEETQLHKQAKWSRAKALRRSDAIASEEKFAVPARSDAGNIAILDDADGVVAKRNPFNLNARTLRFVPAGAPATGYRYELDTNTYDANAATAGTLLKLGDDDTREIPLPFAFTFYGAQYRSIWLNSDGNLTFGSGDSDSTDRSLGRFTSAAPRIAPLYSDLDPSMARTGIKVLSEASRVVVSWVEVPDYRDTGTGTYQTFQARLYPDGRIELAYSVVNKDDAVVGITPGRLQGATSLVSFLNDTSQTYTSTIAERFAGADQVDIFAAAQKFYQNHEDSYDYLVFYNTLGIDADSGAVAYEVTVRNNRKGYGDVPTDSGFETGSKARLQGIMNMGSLDQYPKDPTAKVPARLSVGDTAITTLAHEAGHLFLAYVSVKDENNGTPMLGYQSAHWAFTFNSEASLLEGNRIQDNGPGASPRFLTTATVEGYSPLDQYLMGFRPAQDVPDTFYVAHARGSRTSGTPRVGVGLDGDRRNVRVDDIIQVAGRRTPDYTVSQRRFRFAFVIITKTGQTPTQDQLQQLETYRAALEPFYTKAASGNATAETSLRRALHVSAFPAAGVLAGSQGRGTVSIETPASAPLTILLSSSSGNVQPAGSVVIPAGATEASFDFTGVRPGVDTLVARASDPAFEEVSSRIQVATPDAIQVTIASGDLQRAMAGSPLPQPVQVRVTDINELPYPGIPLQVSVTKGGVVTPASITTDANGVASFRWTPGPDAINELRASVPGGATAVATALGRPVFAANSVVNAASFAPGLTAGGIGTVFGANLVSATLLINGRAAQIFYSGPRQINFFVPVDTPEGTAQLSIITSAGTSYPVTVPVASSQPGLFFDAATGYGAVTVAGTGQVTQVRPAVRGDVLEIYLTGMGPVQNGSNGLRTTVLKPEVYAGGLPAEVLFSGLAPGFVGLYQVNARIPAGIATGSQPLSVVLNGSRSNEVKVEIR